MCILVYINNGKWVLYHCYKIYASLQRYSKSYSNIFFINKIRIYIERNSVYFHKVPFYKNVLMLTNCEIWPVPKQIFYYYWNEYLRWLWYRAFENRLTWKMVLSRRLVATKTIYTFALSKSFCIYLSVQNHKVYSTSVSCSTQCKI